jgi:hypothetical protein
MALFRFDSNEQKSIFDQYFSPANPILIFLSIRYRTNITFPISALATFEES